jgi:hypothetical protein
MRKRNDTNKNGRLFSRGKLKRFVSVLFCIILFIFLVSVTDISTRRMIMCKDDKFALGLKMTENNLLRIDIAGEKYFFNAQPALDIKNAITAGSRKYIAELKEFVGSKLE